MRKKNKGTPTLSSTPPKFVCICTYAALIVGGATLLVEGGVAIAKSQKAKKIAKANMRPTYNVNPEIAQNQQLAASLAGSGFSDATKTLATQTNERNVSQSLDAIMRGGGGVNQVADIYANNQDFLLKLASEDARLQQNNITQFLNANSALGQEEQTAWNVNKYGPYADNAQLVAQLRQESMQALGKGIQGAEQGASNYLTANLYKTKAPDTSIPQSKFDVSKTGDINNSEYGRYMQQILDQQNSDPINKYKVGNPQNNTEKAQSDWELTS